MNHYTFTIACMHCWQVSWREVPDKTSTLSLTTARADHRCIFRVGASGTTAAAIIQAGLISIAVPASFPLSARSLSKGSLLYRQYGISIPQPPTDHICFCDVPGVVTDSLPLTTTVHFHAAFILVSATNKTNFRGGRSVCMRVYRNIGSRYNKQQNIEFLTSKLWFHELVILFVAKCICTE